MTSHDSLSPPYTNSRVTGMVQAKCVCMGTCICFYSFIFAIHFFLAISFRFTALSGPDCVRVCLRRISETLAYTGGDRSSGMQFLSLFPLLARCVEKRQAVCAHLPMMLSASGSLRCGASCEQMATDTDNLPLSLSLSSSHTVTQAYNHWNTHVQMYLHTHMHTHTKQSLITFDWMHQKWKMLALSYLTLPAFFCHFVSCASSH